MKIYLVLYIMLISFVLLAACSEDFATIPITGDATEQALLATVTEVAKTAEAILQTVTAHSIPPTATPTPTRTPDPGSLNKTLSDSIKDQLISTFGASIIVQDVKFGPIGAQEFTNLYIEVSCQGENNAACPTTNVMIALMEACKEKKKKILENTPKSTRLLTITIFDPLNSPRVLEVNWSDVLAFVNGDIPADVFSRLIRYIQ